MNARLALPAIAIVTASVTQPMLAQTAPHQLVFTEDSSGLNVTYDGLPISVTPTGPQSWTVQFPSNLSFTLPPEGWLEPENGALINTVTFGSTGHPTQVSSEADLISFVGLVWPDEKFVPVGLDSSDNNSIFASFDDEGEPTATVSDTGSTFGLLFLALVALVSATRFRQLRLA
jgi:hypothetical protein